MVENRPVADTLAHLVLLLGVLIIAFPLYITLVASTQTADAIVQNAPMSLLPGDQLIPNYTRALAGSNTQGGSNPPVAPMMMVSLITALVIAVGKIAISLLSAFAAFRLNVPELEQLPQRVRCKRTCTRLGRRPTSAPSRSNHGVR